MSEAEAWWSCFATSEMIACTVVQDMIPPSFPFRTQKGQTATNNSSMHLSSFVPDDTGAHSFVLVTSCGRCASNRAQDGECGIQYTAQDTLVITTTV